MPPVVCSCESPQEVYMYMRFGMCNNKAANQIWETQHTCICTCIHVHVANSAKIEILLYLASIISGLQFCEASASI